jgi:flavin-dependent dehydrogenase
VLNESYYVAIVGAGPAGMFAARELARNGAKVIILIAISNPAAWPNTGFIPINLP